jgi:hypothetical protein
MVTASLTITKILMILPSEMLGFFFCSIVKTTGQGGPQVRRPKAHHKILSPEKRYTHPVGMTFFTFLWNI